MSPSFPIFNDLKLLTVSEIFDLRLLTFVFQSSNETSPEYGLKSICYLRAKFSKAFPVELRRAASKILLKSQLKI